MLFVIEAFARRLDFTGAFDENSIWSVDHDFRNAAVAQKTFKRTEAEYFVDDLDLQRSNIFGATDIVSAAQQLIDEFAYLDAQFGELSGIIDAARRVAEIHALRD